MRETKMNKKLISVIVPVYNTEEYFERCISSILRQSYKNIEVIVINDGSPGNICEMIHSYLKMDPRIKFVDNKENQGLLKARVCGAEIAQGEYIAFVDSDDYLSFDFYRTLIRRAEATKSDIVIGKTVWEDEGECSVYNYHDNCFTFTRLTGMDIRKAYFAQETNCYSWHTIWNKLYSKKLWDKCMAFFREVSEHIIMTEDIFFSSILFYEAEVLTKVNNDAYFYCTNKNASTNSMGISLSKFKKNMSDISFVFNQVDMFLQAKKASQEIVDHFLNARKHYARMWRNLANDNFKAEERKEAMAIVDRYCSTLNENINDHFFESIRTTWNGGLEYMKEQVALGSEQYISFDIFDTLITRPFYQPEDIFTLLDGYFSKLTGSTVSFAQMRKEGERLARLAYGKTHPSFEDINIDEIYEYIETQYALPHQVIKQMLIKEAELEINFCRAREAGKELYELALDTGKKVLLITDMYLRKTTIEEILKKNGYVGYAQIFVSCEERKLKYNSGLFKRVLANMPDVKDNIVHIGDTWKSDIQGSEKANIKSIFLPKAREIFENKIQNCSTNRCADIGKGVYGDILNYQKATENIGFRCMRALVLNRYFDNPYRTFHAGSDFNIDPYFIGYYTLGMHMLGMAKWIDDEIIKRNCKNVYFLARDGYLPIKVYKKYQQNSGTNVSVSYMQASRRALLPAIVKEKINFYQLPIEYRGHTPNTLLSMLDFAAQDISSSEWGELLKKNEMKADAPFEDSSDYYKFINVFLGAIYSKEKHRIEYQKARQYYARVVPNSLVFDIGYSGRIHAAICELCGEAVDALFVHEDYHSSIRLKNHSGFKIASFYDAHPNMTGLVREHILSETAGSCTGFQEKDGLIEPVFEDQAKRYSDLFVVNSLQQGAIDFVGEFVETFAEYMDQIDFSTQEVSLPFEGFLRTPGDVDLGIFSESYFEDMVYGAKEQINIEKFVRQQLHNMDLQKERLQSGEQKLTYDSLVNLLNQHSKLVRAILLLIIDRETFKQKFVKNWRKFFSR